MAPPLKPYELDCQGSLCPQPILDLADWLRAKPVGSELIVISDDLAFPLDVEAWCGSHGQELVELRTNGRQHRAWVRKVRG